MVINVLVEISSFNVDKTFFYRVTKDLEKFIRIGVRVLVPFANQTLEGFILSIEKDYSGDIELKNIIRVIDEEVILTDELLQLGKYISERTLSTLISSYQVMLPKSLKAQNKPSVGIKKEAFIEINNLDNIKLNPRQQEIIDLLKKEKSIPYMEIKKTNSSIDTLLKKSIVKKVFIEKYRMFHNNNFQEKKVLTEDQKKVSNEVISNLNTNLIYLLYGVTGSGKTEVYMEIIEKVVQNGKKALLLVPEITLTSQILKRFSCRFDKIAVLHSGLSDGEKYDEYRRIKRDEVNIVIGARSAIFAPLTKIGVIIIDECHTDSYRQDNMPRYDAIDIAIKRSSTHKCPLILGSATPSLEMFARAQKGLFKLITLPKRVGNSVLPRVIPCDMTKEKRVKNTTFSETLYKKIVETLNNHEQVILLINRRGYSNSLMCKDCGHTIKCPNCDISLTYHKTKELLRCHYCGYATKKVSNCPVCHQDTMREIGSGTERVEEEIKQLFPDARVLRMDLDTTTKKNSHEKMVNDFANFKYDILLGTQMIAKGLDFDNVTLVGVLNADTSLFIPSYKSSESTFQLLNQVSGRSGRREKQGCVVIQSFNVNHYAIEYACKNDYLSFYKKEMPIRLSNKYPPYYFLTYIIIKSKDYDFVSVEANRIYNILRQQLPNFIILGPSVCVPFKINNVCRFGILIKYKKEDNLNIILRQLIDHYKANSRISLDITFNPNNI